MILIQIAGHLGSDPETRVSPDGTKRTTFSIATNIRRKDKDETVWWRVTIWGDRFDKLLPYLKKGSAVIVAGTLSNKPEIYTDKAGTQQVSSLELRAEMISFSPFGKSDRSEQQQQQQSNGGAQYSQGAQSYSAPSYQAPSYNTQQSSTSAPGFAPNPQAGSTFGQSTQTYSQTEEEPLPF